MAPSTSPFALFAEPRLSYAGANRGEIWMALEKSAMAASLSFFIHQCDAAVVVVLETTGLDFDRFAIVGDRAVKIIFTQPGVRPIVIGGGQNHPVALEQDGLAVVRDRPVDITLPCRSSPRLL